MSIVAFCGERGAGKDTAALGLRLHDFTPMAFADPIRAIGEQVFGMTMHEMTDRDLKEAPLGRGSWPDMSPRGILKLVGTECFRDHFSGVWIQALQRRASATQKNIAITDCRFQDEADAIHAMGGLLIRVDNPNVPPGTDQHRSEIEWKQFAFDAVLVNDCADAAGFQAKVAHWWSQYSRLLTAS